jgi:PAS domain S-box-containing protein
MPNKHGFEPWSMEEAFRLLVERIDGYAIFMLDERGHIISWNKGAEKLFGWKAGEVINKHFSILFTEEDNKKKIPEKELLTAASEGRASDNIFHNRKNGDSFYADGDVTAMRDDFGQVFGFVKIMKAAPPPHGGSRT